MSASDSHSAATSTADAGRDAAPPSAVEPASDTGVPLAEKTATSGEAPDGN